MKLRIKEHSCLVYRFENTEQTLIGTVVIHYIFVLDTLGGKEEEEEEEIKKKKEKTKKKKKKIVL